MNNHQKFSKIKKKIKPDCGQRKRIDLLVHQVHVFHHVFEPGIELLVGAGQHVPLQQERLLVVHVGLAEG